MGERNVKPPWFLTSGGIDLSLNSSLFVIYSLYGRTKCQPPWFLTRGGIDLSRNSSLFVEGRPPQVSVRPAEPALHGVCGPKICALDTLGSCTLQT